MLPVVTAAMEVNSNDMPNPPWQFAYRHGLLEAQVLPFSEDEEVLNCQAGTEQRTADEFYITCLHDWFSKPNWKHVGPHLEYYTIPLC